MRSWWGLRARLSVVIAALALVATGATAGVSYKSTRDQLYGEVDAAVMRRAVEGARRPTILGDRGLTRPGPPLAWGRPLVGPDMEAQLIDARGDVHQRSGDVALPVDASARSTAEAGAPGRLQTVAVAGVHYRVATVPVGSGFALQVARDLSETRRVLAALQRRFVGVGLMVLAASLATGWWIARRTARPLERLTETAEYVASTGDLAARITTSSSDETGRLSRAFATMLDALHRSRAQQRQLVQDASHELRTPLTSIRTNLEVLDRYPQLGSDKRDALLRDVRSELGELSSLIEELVDLAADRRDDEEPVAVDLDALTTRAVARAERRHQRPFAAVGRAGTVHARPAALARALSNLFDNAAKFSPPAAAVEVVLAPGRVAVRDRGHGIDPADLPFVFDRFYRAAAARNLAGSGLGLAIVRQTIEGDGGVVFARNHPEGGAVVGFELPH